MRATGLIRINATNRVIAQYGVIIGKEAVMRGAIWLVIAVVGLLGLAISAAASESEEWRQDLDVQISYDYPCEVFYLTGVIEREIEGQLMVWGAAASRNHRTASA
jgi:hypothetical protein